MSFEICQEETCAHVGDEERAEKSRAMCRRKWMILRCRGYVIAGYTAIVKGLKDHFSLFAFSLVDSI